MRESESTLSASAVEKRWRWRSSFCDILTNIAHAVGNHLFSSSMSTSGCSWFQFPVYEQPDFEISRLRSRQTREAFVPTHTTNAWHEPESPDHYVLGCERLDGPNRPEFPS